MDAPDIPSKPCGELVTRIVAMPKDTNPNSDIWGAG
jgi:acyl-CoA hydrolase